MALPVNQTVHPTVPGTAWFTPGAAGRVSPPGPVERQVCIIAPAQSEISGVQRALRGIFRP